MLLLGLENAYVLGPLAVQAEYIRSYVDVNSPGTATQFRNVHFDGYYAQTSYFLTGEHRPYRKKDGYFGRVKPKKNFSLKRGGLGAWEVAARYSHANLDRIGPSSRKYSADANYLLTRFQVDF